MLKQYIVYDKINRRDMKNLGQNKILRIDATLLLLNSFIEFTDLIYFGVVSIHYLLLSNHI